MSALTDDSGAYFVSVDELGRRVGLGRTTMYELITSGRVCVVRYGKRVLVPVTEVERLALELLATADLSPPGKREVPVGDAEPGLPQELHPGANRTRLRVAGGGDQ